MTTTENREIVEGLNGRGRRVWVVQGPNCEHEVFDSLAEAESWLRYAATPDLLDALQPLLEKPECKAAGAFRNS